MIVIILFFIVQLLNVLLNYSLIAQYNALSTWSFSFDIVCMSCFINECRITRIETCFSFIYVVELRRPDSRWRGACVRVEHFTGTGQGRWLNQQQSSQRLFVYQPYHEVLDRSPPDKGVTPRHLAEHARSLSAFYHTPSPPPHSRVPDMSRVINQKCYFESVGSFGSIKNRASSR